MDLAEANHLKRKSLYAWQIIQILLSFFRFILDSAYLKITICLKGSTLLGTLRDEGDKPVSFKCNSPMCYALLAGNQRYGVPNRVGSSETTRDYLTYFYMFRLPCVLLEEEIKLKYDIVQKLIYELLLGLMKLRQFFLLNLSFLLELIIFTVIIFIYPVLLYDWENICVCSVVPVKEFSDLDKLESIKSHRSSLKTNREYKGYIILLIKSNILVAPKIYINGCWNIL